MEISEKEISKLFEMIQESQLELQIKGLLLVFQHCVDAPYSIAPYNKESELKFFTTNNPAKYSARISEIGMGYRMTFLENEKDKHTLFLYPKRMIKDTFSSKGDNPKSVDEKMHKPHRKSKVPIDVYKTLTKA